MTQKTTFQNKVHRSMTNSLVDKAADLIRTAVDYKFILVLLFLKRLSDIRASESRGRKIKPRKGKQQTGVSETEKIALKIPKELLWDSITQNGKTLPDKLATSMREIAQQIPELRGAIDKVDFLEFARNQENQHLLVQLVALFNSFDLGPENISADHLGNAYEHILLKFAPDKAKEGEIYTPLEVIELLVEILNPRPGETVYDPCCGSGGMLIRSYLWVTQENGKKKSETLSLYGQERNPGICSVSAMNFLFHEIKNARLENGDTLEFPRFTENGKLKQFDVVIANIPWNQDGYGQDRLTANFPERFRFGFPPQNSADWAWIEHGLASANKRGRAGIIVDNGCLFRGSQERTVRSRIIREDLVECVILLPEKLFYNTGAPGVIIVFNRNKSDDRKRKVLFVNASNEFEPHQTIRRLNFLSDDNIAKTVAMCRKFRESEGFSRIVEMSEIAKNEFNLNVPLYVASSRPVESISISDIYSELRRLGAERAAINKKLEDVVSQIIQVE